MNPSHHIGIVFNAYEPELKNLEERRSEESVADMAGEVCDAVQTLGYEVTLVPLQKNLYRFLDRIKSLRPDVLINLCEGYLGRPQWEANIAGLFEMVQIPFTGSGSKALGLCQNKFKAKSIFSAFGLPTAPARLAKTLDTPCPLDFPLIVKPNSEDASLGILPGSVVHDRASYQKQLGRILQRYREGAIVESYIEGREFNVTVMENGTIDALPVSEIDFSQLPDNQPRIVSYEAKWFEDNPLYRMTPPVCPADIDEELRVRLQTIAVEAFRVMECRDYARVDMRENEAGQVFILEVNPNPDISLNAGYARALTAAGIEYPDFWQKMIRNAAERTE